MIVTNVIVVGSGPAGIGVASLLNQTDINYVVLERKDVGNSFLEWPEGMEMITPSFPSNAFGQIDLNSVCESTSPAFSFNKEHLTGEEYSDYLAAVVYHFEINVLTNTEVTKVSKHKSGWVLETNEGMFYCKYLVWAAGEFQNPQMSNITGSEHCVHSSHVKRPGKMEGDRFVIIGGYESGVQLALDLISNDKEVTLINPEPIDSMDTSDPSRVLSPYTYAKYVKMRDSPLYKEILGEVVSVTEVEGGYSVQLADASTVESEQIPICATGFSLVKGPIEEFVSFREDGSPKLHEETDEFFGWKNIYLSGPSVRHENHIFCFIYKFRQRFGVIVEDILRKEKYSDTDIALLVNKWKENGMYLADLSCCGEECVC